MWTSSSFSIKECPGPVVWERCPLLLQDTNIVVRQKGLLECCLWETIVLPSAHSLSSDEEVVVGICKSLKWFLSLCGLRECGRLGEVNLGKWESIPSPHSPAPTPDDFTTSMALPRLCCRYQVKNRSGWVLPSHLLCFYFFHHSLFFSSSCFWVSLSLFFTSVLFTIFLPLNVFPLETKLKNYLSAGAHLSEKCVLCCVESRLKALEMDIIRKDFFAQ